MPRWNFYVMFSSLSMLNLPGMITDNNGFWFNKYSARYHTTRQKNSEEYQSYKFQERCSHDSVPLVVIYFMSVILLI